MPILVFKWEFLYWYVRQYLYVELAPRGYVGNLIDQWFANRFGNCTIIGCRALIQYKDDILPVQEIPLWR